MQEDFKKQGDFLFRWRTYLPLIAFPLFVAALFHSEPVERIFGDFINAFWEGFCLVVSLAGLTARVMVAGYVPRGTSGRNTRSQVADTLNTTGMYSVVRNPLYLGNFLIVLGIFLFIQVWWLILIGVVGFWFYYERIIYTEEDFLRKKFGSVFMAWEQKTPVIIPRFRKWQAPEYPFSVKTVLRREHSTFFSMLASFAFLDVAADLLAERKFEIEPFWGALFFVGLITYLTLRTLKKKTHVLDVPGR